MKSLEGTDIGRYHILEQLGEGGMATIYKAVDSQLDREVAIKFLRTERLDSKKTRKRFELEARALARLKHPNIVQVLDYGEHESSPYLVMEYQEGGSLSDRLGDPLPWQEAISILLPVAKALAYAHKNKILHRDVKPSNILLSQDGRPMLSDFGVAEILEMEETLDLTGSSVGIGTPYYMAPEQGLSKNIDQRADIYSLGIVFYEIVTGRKPYQGETPMAVLFKHASDPLPRPGEFTKGLPREVERIIIKALMKEPAQRYQNMEEFTKVLEALLQRLLSKENKRSKKKKVQDGNQTKKWLWVGISGGVILITALGYFLRSSVELFRFPNQEQEITSTILPTFTPTITSEPTTTFLPAPSETVEMTQDEKIYAGSQKTSPIDGMVMVGIPAGSFVMGSENGDSDESPTHKVYLDGFWMDKYEVTYTQFNKFMDEEDYRASPCWYGNLPVACVSWFDAAAYCEWADKRLPTEAEWEKASRGGRSREKFPWGNSEPSCENNTGIDPGDNIFIPTGDANFTWVGRLCINRPLEGGSFRTNKYGLYDMAGNVWEWVSDWYGFYTPGDQTDPQGPESGEHKVYRGGSLWYSSYYLRNASRTRTDPETVSNDIGFRCVMSAQEQ